MNVTPLRHLSARIFDTPLLLHPGKGDVILSVLGKRLGLAADAIPRNATFGKASTSTAAYAVTDGIVVIPMFGMLVKRSGGAEPLSQLCAYGELAAIIQGAFDSPSVNGVVFDIDSPGGETTGMADLADLIYSLRGQKPMIAVANDSCYSAAYGIASAADQVYVTRDGGVGSVGAYMMHCDRSGANEQAGLKYTCIFAGDHKIDGNPMEPLSDGVKSELQQEVDRCRDSFVSLVARNRGVTTRQILNTQAACFYADKALPLLADRIGSIRDAMAALQALI